MKRNTVQKILNPLLVVLAVNQGITVIFKDSMTGETFALFHQTFGIIFIALIALHFVLNLNWVKANYFSRSGKEKE